MKAIHLIKFRYIICFVFILIINLNTTSVSGQEDAPLNWVTSRNEAIATALKEGKYILLVAGSDT